MPVKRRSNATSLLANSRFQYTTIKKAVVLGTALALGHVSFDVLEVAWMEKRRP